jgi:hypothetical protein
MAPSKVAARWYQVFIWAPATATVSDDSSRNWPW